MMFFSVNIKRLVLFALLVLVIVVVGGSDEGNLQNNKSKQNHNIVKQDGRVRFTLGDREFNVPAGNFKGGTETGGGRLIRATLWGLLPDFEGYDKTKNHAEFVGVPGWGRRVQIELYRRGDRITVASMVSRSDQVDRGGALGGRLGKYDEIRYGLEYYRSDNWGTDIYLYIEDSEPKMFIRCPSEIALKGTPSPSCSYYWDISAETSYEMRYSMDYLPQWREIWNNVQQLVNGKK